MNTKDVDVVIKTIIGINNNKAKVSIGFVYFNKYKFFAGYDFKKEKVMLISNNYRKSFYSFFEFKEYLTKETLCLKTLI